MSKTHLIIPCYNEATRLPGDAVIEFLDGCADVDVCFVNDGSRDDTIGVLQRLRARNPGRIDVVDPGFNQGKGNAVRSGILHVLRSASPDFVGYWDADLATPLFEVNRFLGIFGGQPRWQLLCGSRVSRLGASIQRKWYRHYLGRVFATMASLAIGAPAYDTQCGAKLFRRELAESVFAEPFLSRWCFDVEILARVFRRVAASDAAGVVLEVPLERWQDEPGSKVTLRHAVRMFVDLLVIRRRYGRSRELRST